MTRNQILLALLLTFVQLTAGLAWEFGAWGLVGPAAAGLIALSFVNEKPPTDKKG